VGELLDGGSTPGDLLGLAAAQVGLTAEPGKLRIGDAARLFG
jgi:hypothetical protein